MNSNKGITLISLISSVILILILASITIVTSVSAYNKMKFEGAKAEIEQMQKLVDEIISDFQTYESEQGTEKTYQDYFKDRYNADNFESKLLEKHETEAASLLSKFPDLKSSGTSESSSSIFYFTKDDINKYFDLKGINDVVVDFSNRIVYSVSGIKDPSDKNTIYYKSSEWGENPKVDASVKDKNSITLSANQTQKSESNYDVKITITGKINNISEVYGGVDEKYSKIDNFRVINSSDSSTTIMVSVNGSGSYKFKVVDELNNSYETSEAIQLQ